MLFVIIWWVMRAFPLARISCSPICERQPIAPLARSTSDDVFPTNDVFASAFACIYYSLLLLFYFCSLSTFCCCYSQSLFYFSIHFALAHLFATISHSRSTTIIILYSLLFAPFALSLARARARLIHLTNFTLIESGHSNVFFYNFI